MVAEPTWDDVVEFATGYIDRGRDALERPQPEDSSNILRGQVKAMRDIITHFTKPKIADPAKTVQPIGIGAFVGPEY